MEIYSGSGLGFWIAAPGRWTAGNLRLSMANSGTLAFAAVSAVSALPADAEATRVLAGKT